MGFMGGLFKVLGFESESKPKAKKQTKTKASYNLNDNKKAKPSQIDGVPVYYPEKNEQCKEFLSFVKEGKAIIISLEYCSGDNEKLALEFIKGFVTGASSKFISLNDKLYLILPEGMEIEE